MVDALLELISFVEPARPGVVAIYPQFALPAQITTTKAVFERLQKEHQLLKSIKCTCFQMLDENFSNQFKVSNIPTLMIGWNASMKIQDILDQLDRPVYGKPDTMMLLTNETHFPKPVLPSRHLQVALLQKRAVPEDLSPHK
jgi:hypothetical protein